jgi:DMSO reductase anchor subunit
MHPALSVILFTVLSGIGFGFLAFLGFGACRPTGWEAFFVWGLGYALSAGGLVASTFHLGNPQRSLRAFTQWRTSWLSREAWASVAALLALAPVALEAILRGRGLPLLGVLGAALCLLAVFTTSMIYAQLKTVPRWNNWTTPATFAAFAVAGGAMLSGVTWLAAAGLVVLGAVLVAGYVTGDGRFAARGTDMGTATGLGWLGKVRAFAPPHTGSNYLLREMVHVVGRKHSVKLRVIALLLAVAVPLLILLVAPPGIATLAVATLVHLTGALAARWLFFAEAEHVVGLYYGHR